MTIINKFCVLHKKYLTKINISCTISKEKCIAEKLKVYKINGRLISRNIGKFTYAFYR